MMTEGAHKLADAIAARGLTQAQAAAACGLSQQSICRYLNGQTLPRIDAALALHGAFGVPLSSWMPKAQRKRRKSAPKRAA